MTVATKHGFINNLIRHYRTILYSLMVTGIFLAGCLTLPLRDTEGSINNSQTSPTELRFKQYAVITGPAQRQTLLTGHLFDDAFAELAVVQLDEKDNRNLRIYGLEGDKWEQKLDTTLRREVLFVDVARIAGRDRLVTYEPGRLSWFDPEAVRAGALVMVTSNFNPPRKDEIPHVDITHDVNGDDRDDLVVPVAEGFQVFVQRSNGTFADPVNIGSSRDFAGIYGADGYRYDPWPESRVYEVDYNRDGRNDLVYWHTDHFAVHTQDEQGLFASVADTFKTEVAFDSDDFYSLAESGMTGKVLHTLTDLNDDNAIDLVTYSLEGNNISSKRSKYEVHFGAPTPDGGTWIGSGVDITFKSEANSIQLAMDRHDFNRDGHGDLMFTSIQVEYLEGSLWKKFKGFMGDDIWLELEFYQNNAGRYSEKPNATRRIALDGAPSHREPGWVPLDLVLRGRTHLSRKTQQHWPRAFNRTLLIGDVTGDGRSDLLIEVTFRGLNVFAGVPGPGLFAQRPQTVAVILPNDEEYSWLVDLNKDGKQDILLHDPFTLRDVHGAPKLPPGSEPYRVTMLIAQ